ncbi:MAG: O-acetylhomoserine aminocarboxypropyltransferase/cysteine synthase, partial [Desulfobacula sp.]|nr:O-acetylhomoserine aminocarboxypropyltransferase/cysteine synthase [Desulfobacula sp.]
MPPQSAYLQTLGLETLSLRISKSCENALFIARSLEKNPKIKTVNYPGLETSEYYHLSRTQFKNDSNEGFASGGVISFELENRDAAFEFINQLKLIKRATNINDNKTLIIHPASTIFADFSSAKKKEMGVTDSLVRLSVGIEDASDLIVDIEQSLQHLEQ